MPTLLYSLSNTAQFPDVAVAATLKVAVVWMVAHCMGVRYRYRRCAMQAVDAVAQYYRLGGAQRAEFHSLLMDRASGDGRDRLRLALAAFADLDQGSGSETARQARVELEGALNFELEEDNDFARMLQTRVAVLAALQGPIGLRPLPSERPAEDNHPADVTSMPADAVLWVATAAGSGILGNAAYDALKAAFRKFMRRREGAEDDSPAIDASQHVPSVEQLTLIARLAVQARCGEMSMTAPSASKLRCTEMTLGESGMVITLDGGWLQARVVVPVGGFDSASDISVTLYTLSPPPGELSPDW